MPKDVIFYLLTLSDQVHVNVLLK